jgi:hypothetical protein
VLPQRGHSIRNRHLHFYRGNAETCPQHRNLLRINVPTLVRARLLLAKPWALTSPALCQVTAPTVLRAATRLAPRGTIGRYLGSSTSSNASLAWPSRLKPEPGPPSAPDRHCRGGEGKDGEGEANLHPGPKLRPARKLTRDKNKKKNKKQKCKSKRRQLRG